MPRRMDIKLSIQTIPVVCNFLDVFSIKLLSLLARQEIKIFINLVSGAQPISKPTYQMGWAELTELGKEIAALKSKMFIKQSHSPWEGPVLFVKKDETFSLYGDYQELN